MVIATEDVHAKCDRFLDDLMLITQVEASTKPEINIRSPSRSSLNMCLEVLTMFPNPAYPGVARDTLQDETGV